jgi:hypothetical protein
MSKHLVKMLIAAVAAMALVAVMAPLAQATTPAPGYGQFAGCPSPSEKATISSCFRGEIKSGTFKMGNKEVPITNPMVLSGGTNAEGGEFSYNSKGGLSIAKQKVPGGVIGLTGLTWLLEILGSEALTLYAVTELAGQVGNPLAPAFHLPVKVHLINSVLGSHCYVGSTSEPINLNLSFSKFPEFVFDPATEIGHLNNGTYTDDTFSAPGANGCVLTLFGFIPISINGLVNAQSGLPAKTGNATTQNFSAELVAQNKVYP